MKKLLAFVIVLLVSSIASSAVVRQARPVTKPAPPKLHVDLSPAARIALAVDPSASGRKVALAIHTMKAREA